MCTAGQSTDSSVDAAIISLPAPAPTNLDTRIKRTSSNDELERREVALPPSESDLSQSPPPPWFTACAHRDRAIRQILRQHDPASPGQGTEPPKTHAPSNSPDLNLNFNPELKRDGPENELKM
jgi:hypothetical protein